MNQKFIALCKFNGSPYNGAQLPAADIDVEFIDHYGQLHRGRTAWVSMETAGGPPKVFMFLATDWRGKLTQLESGAVSQWKEVPKLPLYARNKHWPL